MPRFAANLSTMFTDRAFLERFGAARKAGFRAVECQFPYEAEAGVQPNDVTFEECFEVYRRNLEHACAAAKSAGRVCLIEPINTRDIPGYLMNTPDEAAALIYDLKRDNLKLQFDFYHAQIMVGDL